MRTVIPFISVSLLSLVFALPLQAVEASRAWYSVNPANWTEDPNNDWVSAVEDGAWTRPANDESELVAADGDEAAHIALNTGDDLLRYTPASASVGDVVHTDATMFFHAAPLQPAIPSGSPQGALSVWDGPDGPTYIGLVNGAWVCLSNNAAPPVTNDYVEVRVTLDYTGPAPTVGYAVKVGNSYVSLQDAENASAFATAVPSATAVSSVGFSGVGKVGAFSGTEVVNLEEYDIYINLDEDTAGFFLGTDLDYGGGSWEHVSATSPAEALRLAAEQKFGPGALVTSASEYGISLISINGMGGFGGSLSSEQDTWGYGDIYFYPVQWVLVSNVWQVAATTIMDYTGESRTFALTFQATAFDFEETAHTFADENDAAVYELLKETYNWNGWGQPQAPNFAVTNITLAAATAEVSVGGSTTLVAMVLPAEALNPNVYWTSLDTTVATVSDAGVVTGVAPGTTTVTATTVDGYLAAECVVTVTAAANALTDGGVSIAAGVGAITFTDIRPGEATARFTGTITGETGASGTFALRYTTTLGGEETKVNVTVVIQADGSALVQGIPTTPSSFFAIGFADKLE